MHALQPGVHNAEREGVLLLFLHYGLLLQPLLSPPHTSLSFPASNDNEYSYIVISLFTLSNAWTSRTNVTLLSILTLMLQCSM